MGASSSPLLPPFARLLFSGAIVAMGCACVPSAMLESSDSGDAGEVVGAPDTAKGGGDDTDAANVESGVAGEGGPNPISTGDGTPADERVSQNIPDATADDDAPMSAKEAGMDARPDVSAPVGALRFKTSPASGYSAEPLSSASVEVDDLAGKPVASSVAVGLSLVGGSGPLTGMTTASTSAGVATFANLVIGSNAPAYTLVATAPGYTPATSPPFSVLAWRPWNGNLVGGTVRHLVVDPATATTAYAGTDEGGVFKTTDGATWAPCGLPGARITAIAIDPNNGGVLYAGNDAQGVFKSTDRGVTWTAANAGNGSQYALSLAVDPSNSQTVYWGTGSAGLLKSTDGGATWSNASDAAFASNGIDAIAVSKGNAQVVYVSSYGLPVYGSADGGGSWTPITGLPANSYVKTFAIDPTNARTVYVGLGETAGGVWKSIGGGAFAKTSAAGELSAASVEDLYILPSTPSTLLAGVYAGSSGVFRSVDSGATWTGLMDPRGSSVLALAVAPSDPEKLYMGHYVIDGGGLTKSDDGGLTFSEISTGLTAFDVHGIAIEPTGAIYVGGGYFGIPKSGDGGHTYSRQTTGLTWDGDFTVAIAPGNPQTLLAGVNGGGIWLSTDHAATWSQTPLGNVVVDSLAVPSASNIYASGYGAGVYASTTAGAAWATVNDPTSPWIYTYGVASDPSSPLTAYLGLGDGVYKTVNGGQPVLGGAPGWTQVDTLVGARVAIDPTNAKHVLAAGFTVRESTDLGATWTDITGAAPVDNGSHAATVLSVLNLGGTAATFVGAGSNGLWHRVGGVWVSSGLAGWSTNVIAADPNNPAVLYAGTAGGGMYRSVSSGN
jgi:hypothetical protein